MRRSGASQAGFTLIELLVVLAVMAVAVALVAPTFTAPMRRPVPEPVAFLEAARARALESGQAVTVMRDGNILWTEEAGERREYTLPRGRRLALDWPPSTGYLPADRLVVFHPDGTAVLARFTVMRPRADVGETELYSVTIDPVHGEIAHAYP